jgi:hypothetical protein
VGLDIEIKDNGGKSEIESNTSLKLLHAARRRRRKGNVQNFILFTTWYGGFQTTIFECLMMVTMKIFVVWIFLVDNYQCK